MSDDSPSPKPPPLSGSAPRPTNLFWLLLKVALGVGPLLALVFAALVAYVMFEKRKYSHLADSHDLKKQVARMANDYLAKRPNGAVVVAVMQRGARNVQGFGKADSTNATPPDAQTMFEIGSITKVFTGVALARLSLDGELKLTDTLRQRLPNEVALPEALQGITLLQLATHTAGLPRLPDNLDLSAKNEANPYANYQAADLYQYLAKARLKDAPGKSADYSNVGVGLLGHALELKAGKPYGQLVRDTICAPLGLDNTVIQLSDEQRHRLASGHNPKGAVVPNWDFAVLAPAGAFRSCAADMAKFIEANLAPGDTPIGKALAESHRSHAESGMGAGGLCWQHTTTLQGDLKITWHNGGTGGYISFIGFDAAHRTGVVILSNYGDAFSGDDAVDRMGMEILKLAAKVSLE